MEKPIARKIHDRRMELKLSLSDIAKRVGVSKATVHRWENGGSIKEDVLSTLAEALELTVGQLLGLPDIDHKNASQEELHSKFSGLNSEKQQIVLALINDLEGIQ